MSARDNPHFKARERETRTYLEPGVPAVIRLDGRAFHSYCRGLARPYDAQFMADMDATAVALSNSIDGVRLAYVQSDEISLLLMPANVADDTAERGFMFGGAVQKLVSISAAHASATFNALRLGTYTDQMALFDARAFSVADLAEARDYFQWRQADARVNSLSMLASAHFSHKRLLGVSTRDRARMLRDIGVEPDNLPADFRHGRAVFRVATAGRTTYFDRRVGRDRTVEFTRHAPTALPAPDFDEPGVFEALLERKRASVAA